MNGIEDRLVRDIATVTGGVDVTESDLNVAREGIARGIESRRQRDRRRVLATAGAAAVLLPVLGVVAFQTFGNDERSAPPVSPASPAPTVTRADDGFLTGKTPTAQRVDGVWRVDNNEILVLFAEDGTMRVDYWGRLFSDPVVSGTYEIEGDLITVNAETSDLSECVGEGFAVRASLPGTGTLHFVDDQSSSEGCSPLQQGERWVLEQVLPTDNAFWRQISLEDIDSWKPPPGEKSLYGDWVAEVADPTPPAPGSRTGHLLEIARDGGYTVADGTGSVVDRGRWSLSGTSTRLTLVSGQDSPTCRQGDRLVLGRVQLGDFGTTAMRASVEENTCGGAWALTGWILSPHVGSR